VLVMYAGRIVERADVHALFAQPRHPYTLGLLGSLPRLDVLGELTPIPGSPPNMLTRFPGCPFAPRCPLRREVCEIERPPLIEIGDGRASACHFHEEVPHV
jgi:oligopeptide/dipeptide ABC transporter ATP-binding protein